MLEQARFLKERHGECPYLFNRKKGVHRSHLLEVRRALFAPPPARRRRAARGTRSTASGETLLTEILRIRPVGIGGIVGIVRHARSVRKIGTDIQSRSIGRIGRGDGEAGRRARGRRGRSDRREPRESRGLTGTVIVTAGRRSDERVECGVADTVVVEEAAARASAAFAVVAKAELLEDPQVWAPGRRAAVEGNGRCGSHWRGW